MKKLFLLLPLLLVFAGTSQAAAAYVNSTECHGVTSCATTWNVTTGNVLVVARPSAGLGNLSDGQGNSYATTLENISNYYSNTNLRATILGSGGAPVTVNSTATEDHIILIEFSGATLTVDGGGAQTGTTSGATCGPLSLTTTADDVLIGIWAENNSGGVVPGFIPPSGTTINASTNAGSSYIQGAVSYSFASAGTYSQSWTQTYGASTSCGFVAIKAATGGGGAVSHTRKVRSN